MLKFGYITEVDMQSGMARVHFTEEDIVSNLLPVSVPASKEDKYYFPYAVNEQVWCLMDENGEFGIIGGAIYSAKDKPTPDADKNKTGASINGKLSIEIDRASGKIKVQNADTSLMELITLLKDFIKNIKVATPSGPSANLITPTSTQIADFENKIEKILY